MMRYSLEIRTSFIRPIFSNPRRRIKYFALALVNNSSDLCRLINMTPDEMKNPISLDDSFSSACMVVKHHVEHHRGSFLMSGAGLARLDSTGSTKTVTSSLRYGLRACFINRPAFTGTGSRICWFVIQLTQPFGTSR